MSFGIFPLSGLLWWSPGSRDSLKLSLAYFQIILLPYNILNTCLAIWCLCSGAFHGFLYPIQSRLPCWVVHAQLAHPADVPACSLQSPQSLTGVGLLPSLLPSLLPFSCFSAHFEGSLLSSSLIQILSIPWGWLWILPPSGRLPRLIPGCTKHFFPELLLDLLSHNINFNLYFLHGFTNFLCALLASL